VCNIELPDFQGSGIAGGEKYGLRFPTTLFDSGTLPAFTINGTVTNTNPNASYSAGATAVLLGLTLTNAIATAGGFTDFADISRIDLLRGAGSIERYSYSLIIRGLTNNPTLQPNDRVLVQKRWW